jgi:hypothetical protein
MFTGAREWLVGIQSGQDVRAPGAVRGYALVLVFTLTGVAGLICLIYKSNPL